MYIHTQSNHTDLKLYYHVHLIPLQKAYVTLHRARTVARAVWHHQDQRPALVNQATVAQRVQVSDAPCGITDQKVTTGQKK